MRFKIIPWILVFYLLIIFSVNAGDINIKFYKENYKAFETVQADVNINGINLTKELSNSNLFLFDQNNVSIPIAKNIIKVNDNSYVFYFDLPNLNPGQYNVGFYNVNYIENGFIKIGNFFTNLNIVEINNSELISIRPAYVLVKVTNK